ncbi:MAG: molybdopterin biosynthesis protein [Candidatus Bathyarchaeia archaeon]
MSDRKVFRRLQSLEEANLALRNLWKMEIHSEDIPLTEALGRVLTVDVSSTVDVPGFDRASMDGFAVNAEDIFNADEQHPIQLKVIGNIEAGDSSSRKINRAQSVEIATGAPIPIGANAVVMVEFTKRIENNVQVFKPVSVGENVTAAGSDIMTGELLLRKSQAIGPREVGLLAAAGVDNVRVFSKPRVAIFSSGNELIKSGETLNFAKLYDINGPTIAAGVTECGGAPKFYGILPDNYTVIKERLRSALEEVDIVISSGSTSSGPGDIIYKVVEELGEPGIIVHGLSLKPGKPVVIGLAGNKPIFGLPGYPTSALMIFHILVAPAIRQLAQITETKATSIQATVPMKFFKARGRRELLPVQLISQPDGNFSAYPMQSGSGAVSSFSLADGFADLPETQEFLEEGEKINVELFGKNLIPPSLVVIGSHCVGVDIIFALLHDHDSGFLGRTINVGSVGGFHAAKLGEADVSGVHLVDESGEYNVSYMSTYGVENSTILIRGYDREQGLIVQRGNPKNIKGFDDLLRKDVTFINRNRGSGTRLLIDKYLAELARSSKASPSELAVQIQGYAHEAKSHSAVAAAIRNHRADVGFGIRSVAGELDFIKTDNEHYDFLIPRSHEKKQGVKQFIQVLKSPEFSQALRERAPGLRTNDQTGETIFP